MNRLHESFREELRKSITPDDMRLMSRASIARCADYDAVNKCMLSIYGQERDRLGRMTRSTEDYYDMERARDSYRPTGAGIDARDFALEDNLCQIYFDYYGCGFDGEELVNRPQDGWTCPGCKLKYMMSLKTMPSNCKRCGWITPLGELRRDGVLRR